MAQVYCLEIDAIAASLKAVQANFDRINATLDTPRDPMTDEVRRNMIAGYKAVDALLLEKIDIFEPGHSAQLLELNTLVLCGRDKQKRAESAQHIKQTKEKFYNEPGRGVGVLMEWLQHHRNNDVWRRAAGAYIHILSQPQLFIEGNHRTGSLIMSYILARDGETPFVLSVDNAKAYFDPSTLTKQSRRRGFDLLTKLPKLSRRFARLLKEDGKKRHLCKCV